MSETTEHHIILGIANMAYISESKGIAAMTGTLKSGTYARVSGIHRDVGIGCFGFGMEDFFIYVNDSTIITIDKSFVPEAAEEITVGGTDYTVVNATGRFAGFTGSFKSRGGALFDQGVDVLRFKGRLAR